MGKLRRKFCLVREVFGRLLFRDCFQTCYEKSTYFSSSPLMNYFFIVLAVPLDSLGLAPLTVKPRKLVTSTIVGAVGNSFATHAQGTEFLSQKLASTLLSAFVSLLLHFYFSFLVVMWSWHTIHYSDLF
jgi:hypothetical protein